jgi:hypothetical protein
LLETSYSDSVSLGENFGAKCLAEERSQTAGVSRGFPSYSQSRVQETPVRSIFISYRRDDSEGEAGRLFDDLVNQFGKNSVFMDVAGIEVGRDFRKAIDQSVATCGVLLAVISKDWLDVKNDAGQRRLEDPSDFVRLETAAALKRDIPVIPVLVRGAKMPRVEQLPEDMRELAYRNGAELTHARWGSDLQLLIAALRPYLEEPAPAPAPRQHRWWKFKATLSFLLTAVAVVAVAALLYLVRDLVRADRSFPLPGPQISSNHAVPNFAGTWEPVSSTLNGVAQGFAFAKPVTISQQGTSVRIGNTLLQLTSAGTLTSRSFYAQDGQRTHAVQSEDQADLVDISTWRIEGSMLVLDTMHDYKKTYGKHPPGVDKHVMEYRRMTP